MTLVANSVTIAFGGVVALSDVSIEVNPGEIVGLVGPNGAGKSTLFNCVTGVVKPASGAVNLDGTDLTPLRLDQRIRLGIGRTFQTPRLDRASTVLEAVMLGFYPRTQLGMLSAFVPLSGQAAIERSRRARARELIQLFELGEDGEAEVSGLSLGRLRLLEVARALASEPKYLLLDEPAAGLDLQDRERLAGAVRKAAAAGIGVLIVEHNVAFVSGLSHRMVALIAGRLVAQGQPDQVTSNRQVIEAYLGLRNVA